MTQTQEGGQEERDLSFWLHRIVKWSTVAMSVAIPLAVVGVALGAMNFMSGPIYYPAWLLAAWMVVDILLLVFLLLHLVLYGVILAETTTQGIEVVCGVLGLVFLIAGGIMLSGKHLAYVSVCELFLLVAATIINIVSIVQMRDLL